LWRKSTNPIRQANNNKIRIFLLKLITSNNNIMANERELSQKMANMSDDEFYEFIVNFHTENGEIKYLELIDEFKNVIALQNTPRNAQIYNGLCDELQQLRDASNRMLLSRGLPLMKFAPII
jgi:hypothetical protein